MNVRFAFSWVGLVVFALPMLPNIAYAVFPVLYYLLAAIWAGNIPAAAITAIFGAAHITVSAMSFR